MSEFKEHKVTRTIKAREVTEEDGEYIVTHRGREYAKKGDLEVVDDSGAAPVIHVVDAETFDTQWLGNKPKSDDDKEESDTGGSNKDNSVADKSGESEKSAKSTHKATVPKLPGK